MQPTKTSTPYWTPQSQSECRISFLPTDTRPDIAGANVEHDVGWLAGAIVLVATLATSLFVTVELAQLANTAFHDVMNCDIFDWIAILGGGM